MNWVFDKQQFGIDVRDALCNVPLSLAEWAFVVRAIAQLDAIHVTEQIGLYAYAWAMMQEVCTRLNLNASDYITKI